MVDTDPERNHLPSETGQMLSDLRLMWRAIERSGFEYVDDGAWKERSVEVLAEFSRLAALNYSEATDRFDWPNYGYIREGSRDVNSAYSPSYSAPANRENTAEPTEGEGNGWGDQSDSYQMWPIVNGTTTEAGEMTGDPESE